MGTEGEVTPSASVTMEELKDFKESLTSFVASEMRELREIIAQLMQAQKSAPPPALEDPNAADAAAKEAADAMAKAASEAEAKAAEDKRDGDKTSTSNFNTDGKPDQKEVPIGTHPTHLFLTLISTIEEIHLSLVSILLFNGNF